MRGCRLRPRHGTDRSPTPSSLIPPPVKLMSGSEPFLTRDGPSRNFGYATVTSRNTSSWMNGTLDWGFLLDVISYISNPRLSQICHGAKIMRMSNNNNTSHNLNLLAAAAVVRRISVPPIATPLFPRPPGKSGI